MTVTGLGPMDILPNYRIADKCCCSCKNYEEDLDDKSCRYGFCGILVKMQKDSENNEFISSIDPSTEDSLLCDLWEYRDNF